MLTFFVDTLENVEESTTVAQILEKIFVFFRNLLLSKLICTLLSLHGISKDFTDPMKGNYSIIYYILSYITALYLLLKMFACLNTVDKHVKVIKFAAKLHVKTYFHKHLFA